MQRREENETKKRERSEERKREREEKKEEEKGCDREDVREGEKKKKQSTYFSDFDTLVPVLSATATACARDFVVPDDT